MLIHLWERAQRASHPQVQPASQPQASLQNALDTIIELIPAEVIGIYMALVGLFGQSWVIFWIGAASIPLFLSIAHFEKRKALNSGLPPSFPKLILVACFAFVAYVPWAATLPDTPFLQFNEHATKIGAGAALILSPILPRLARLLGLN
jgi:hypothetical protein